MLQLTSSGFLPPGIHDASLDEIQALFGQFQETDRRQRLFKKLQGLVHQIKSLSFIRHLIVNGSFVTSKPNPEDIDLILAIEPEILQRAEWAPAEYNALSSQRLRRQYQFDVFVAPADGSAYCQYIELFSRIKGSPDGQKGVVRLQL